MIARTAPGGQVEHLIAHLGTTIVMGMAYPIHPHLAAHGVLLIGYAAIIELGQLEASGRHASSGDIAFSATGVAIGGLCLWIAALEPAYRTGTSLKHHAVFHIAHEVHGKSSLPKSEKSKNKPETAAVPRTGGAPESSAGFARQASACAKGAAPVRPRTTIAAGVRLRAPVRADHTVKAQRRHRLRRAQSMQGSLASHGARYARIRLFSVCGLLLHARYVARYSEYPPLEMNGVRVLLVEDAELIGELMHDMFRDAGATVVAQPQSVPAALRILRTQPVDVVCLDILLGYQPSFAVADLLVQLGIPFVFVTACDPHIVPERHRTQLLVDKDDIPYLLVPACRAVMARARLRTPVANNPAGRPHPVGGRP